MTARELILLEVQRRIQGLASDWEAILLQPAAVETNVPRLALISWERDVLLSPWTMYVQSRELTVVVRVQLRIEDAVAGSGDNGLRLLDQALQEIEHALFGQPGFDVSDVQIVEERGVEVSIDSPEGANLATGALRFAVGYRTGREEVS